MATITVVFDGDSAPLVAAAGEAGAAFDDMAASADAATTDIAASMADLGASMDGLQASIDMLSASFDSMATSGEAAAASVDTAGASATAATVDAEGLGGAIEGVSGAFDMLTGSITPLLATFGTLIAVMGAMVIINDVTSWVENLIQQMFTLDQQTQKTVNSWQYLFATVKGGGKAAAQGLAGWAYQESPNLPFTAMDLRAAISTLGTAGYSPAQIEQFIPYLADIASTLGTSAYGGQGVNLEQAAMAIRSAGFGLTRMLRTDLGISPAQLVPYGLDATVSSSGAVKIKDMASLLPSIMAFARGRGLAGAAQSQEVNTFWGAWSSFQDYLQNWLQTTGGINPATGQVEKGSMFGGLQQILVGVNSVLGQAQVAGAGTGKGASISGLTGVLGNILGGGVQGGISLFEGISGGAGAGGAGKVVQDLYTSLQNFGNWLTSAPIQKDIQNIGKGIGEFMAQALKLAQMAMPDLEHALHNLVVAWDKLTGSMSGGQASQMRSIGANIIEITAAVLSFVAALITAAAAVNQFTTNMGHQFRTWAENLASQFRTWGQNFIDMLIQGIQSALPNLGAMLNNVASSIKARLGFSSPPKEGPLSDSDRYMPNMMMMFATGIERGLPAVARASQMAALAIAGPIHGGMGVGGGVSNTNYSSALNYGAQSNALTINGANAVETELYIRQILQKLDRQHNAELLQAGGFGYRSFGPVG